jgi:hypothetical protein
MRQSLIGGLVLATAAVLTGPRPAHAQPGSWAEILSNSRGPVARGQMDYDAGIPGRPPIIAPIPTGNPGGNGFYWHSEFVFLTQTFALGDQWVAVRGLIDSTGQITGLPGTLIGTGFPALTTGQFGRRSYFPGWNMGLGYKFDNGIAVFANFTQMLDHKYSAGASLVPPYHRSFPDLADTFLTAPVYNFPPDFAGPLQVSGLDLSDINQGGNFYGIWNGASVMTIEFTQRYTEGEIGARVPLYQTEYSRVYGLGGARYAWFFERFKWRTVAHDVFGRAFPFDTALYTNTLSQRMYGPFCGCGHEVYIGKRTAVSLDLTVSPLINVAKERVKYILGDRTTQAKRSRDDFTVVPNGNADLNFWWYPIEGVQFRFGYQAMTFFNTRYMKEPIAFDFGALDPVYETRAFRIVHGFHVGLGLFF